MYECVMSCMCTCLHTVGVCTSVCLHTASLYVCSRVCMSVSFVYVNEGRLPPDGHCQSLGGAGARTDDVGPQPFGLKDVEEGVAGRDGP